MNEKKTDRYVSRAGLKLAYAATEFGLDFVGKVVLDVGSSTGGFTDFVLKNGAKKVIAIEKGKDQLSQALRDNQKIELHEQTDILDVEKLPKQADFVLIDVSFISLRKILLHVSKIAGNKAQIIAMFKPQFEAKNDQKNRGVIKNERMRREIMKDFEGWAKRHFVIKDKTDSKLSGQKGNVERFYLLCPLSN